MMQRSVRWCAVLVILAAGVCAAQEQDVKKGEKERKAKPRQRGDRAGRRGPAAQMDRLIKELKLDEEQQSQVRELFKGHEEKTRALRSGMRPGPEARERMRAFREAMQEAREAGDEARIAELQEERRASQAERKAKLDEMQKKLAAAEKELHDGVLELLNEDQTAPFEELWREMRAARRRPFGEARRSPRALRTVLEKLPDLTEEQKKEVDGLFEAFKKASREIEKESPEHRKLAGKLYRDVTQVLTAEQRLKVMQELRGRRGGGERGERDRRRRDRGGEHDHGGDG